MTVTLAISMLVPIAAVAACLGARRGRVLKFVEDRRGIALQTVIIMVVLIAIAGGVAAVLLTRGGDAVEDLEQTNVVTPADSYKVQALCEAANYSWDSGSSECK